VRWAGVVSFWRIWVSSAVVTQRDATSLWSILGSKSNAPDAGATSSASPPTAFVLSANVHRRNLSTGQRAMAVAMLRPAPEKRGRGNKSAINGDFTGAPQQRIADARAVLNYSPELAQAVMHGEKPLQAEQIAALLGVARETVRNWLTPIGRVAKVRNPGTDSRVKLTGHAKEAAHDRIDAGESQALRSQDMQSN